MIKKGWALAAALMLLVWLPLPVLGSSGSYSAKAVVLMEADSGRILYAQNENEQLPMASTTKIITALIALEQPNLDEYFVVDEQAIQVEGTSMGLQPGDQVTMRTLAWGMLLASGNDAANAAAVKISGSIPAFAQLMNQRVQGLGATNTHLVTPSGLDDEEHYTTAKDLAMIARAALQNEDFAAICSTRSVAVTYGNPPYKRYLSNHNKLLSTYEGANGVKTGFTKKSGRCLVSSAERDGVTLICVTLGASDDWAIHQELLDRGFEQLTATQVPLQGDLTVQVTNSSVTQVGAVPMETPVVALKEGEKAQVVYELFSQMEYAPVTEGQVLGKAKIYVGDQLLKEVPLVADRDAPQNPMPPQESWWKKFWNWLTGWFRRE